MIAKRDNKHRAVELLKSIFENNFYSQDERRMLSPHTLKEYTDRCQGIKQQLQPQLPPLKLQLLIALYCKKYGVIIFGQYSKASRILG